MARKADKATAGTAGTRDSAKAVDPRRKVVEALMHLAATQPYASITLSEIAHEAGLSLADLRDLFPSKGAILGGLMRMVDRTVLTGSTDDMADESAHDRVLDVMMRRFDALAPYKAGLASAWRDLRYDPAALLAFNQAALNSWRFMLESAGIETGGGLGLVRTQGAVLVFSRAFEAWLEDGEDMARTMAVLDTELRRGEKVLSAADALHRLTAPLRGMARAACTARRSRRPASGEDMDLAS